MEINYQLTQRDFFDSMIAHTRRGILPTAVIAFICGCLGWILFTFNKDSGLLLNLRPLFFAAILWPLIILGGFWWSARSQFLKQPAAQGIRTLLAGETGIHLHWSASSADVEWKNFVRFVESKRIFLLYTSPIIMQMVPKRVLTAEQISEFRAILEKNISRGR